MKENYRNRIEEMYKNVGTRPVELVFCGNTLKKSIGLRRPPSDLLRELDDDPDVETEQNPE